jgi:hypothetical protein
MIVVTLEPDLDGRTRPAAAVLDQAIRRRGRVD